MTKSYVRLPTMVEYIKLIERKMEEIRKRDEYIEKKYPGLLSGERKINTEESNEDEIKQGKEIYCEDCRIEIADIVTEDGESFCKSCYNEYLLDMKA